MLYPVGRLDTVFVKEAFPPPTTSSKISLMVEILLFGLLMASRNVSFAEYPDRSISTSRRGDVVELMAALTFTASALVLLAVVSAVTLDHVSSSRSNVVMMRESNSPLRLFAADDHRPIS